jgi:RNA polymerase sigma-70 factor, ECF subfamily
MAAYLRIQSVSTNCPGTNDHQLKSSEIVTPIRERVASNGDGTGSGAEDWPELVMRIQRGDESGMEDLYHLFARGIRFYLCRQLRMQEVDDKVHDTFLIVVQAIRRGDLRKPERLMGFVRTVVRRQVAALIDAKVHGRRDQADFDVGARVADRRLNPEENTAFEQKVALMQVTLLQLSDRDREILTRFYLREETQRKICQEMHLTAIQFRLFKSRAKARFGELGKRNLRRKMVAPVFLRMAAGLHTERVEAHVVRSSYSLDQFSSPEKGSCHER